MKARAAAAVRQAQLEINRRLGRPLTATVHGLEFDVSPDDDGPSRALYVWRETPEFDVLPRALAAAAEPVTGSVLVDVGANIGTTTVLALRRYGFGRAVAIEPDPENVVFLRKNLARNAVERSVDVVNAAAAAEPGEGTFKLGRETGGGRRLAGAGSMLGPKHRAAEEIPMRIVTVDGMLDELGISPSDVGLLWLDVQGFEGHVAAGAEQVLRAARPFVFAFRARKLARAGELDRLRELVASSYAHVLDLRDPHAQPLPAADLASFTERHGTTDILAFGRPQ